MEQCLKCGRVLPGLVIGPAKTEADGSVKHIIRYWVCSCFMRVFDPQIARGSGGAIPS